MREIKKNAKPFLDRINDEGCVSGELDQRKKKGNCPFSQNLLPFRSEEKKKGQGQRRTGFQL